MDKDTFREIVGDYFQYTYLQEYFTTEEIEKYKIRIRDRYRKIVLNWDKKINTEWIIRNYLATKMILAATVMYTSLEYSLDKNLKIVHPYLAYYTMLNSCRSLCFTIPEENWNDGDLMKMSHSKIINCTCSLISSISKNLGMNIKNKIISAKDTRELFSYKFPASGFKSNLEQELIDTQKISSLILEISQFNSEQLQYCIGKYYGYNKCIIDREILTNMCIYEGETYYLIDYDDLYRLDYIFRKEIYPLNLYWTMTEGLVEDFLGSWCNDNEENAEIYNPDADCRCLFPVP